MRELLSCHRSGSEKWLGAQNVVLENAWIFAPEDAVADSVKAYLDFEKRLLEPIPKPDRAKTKLTDISGVWGLCSADARRMVPGCIPAAPHPNHLSSLATSVQCSCMPACKVPLIKDGLHGRHQTSSTSGVYINMEVPDWVMDNTV